MMEFQKKIIPYLDGSLSKEELAEFEAFVATHPEFQKEIRSKQEEIDLLRSLIPDIPASQESLESIRAEMRTSVFGLLREEPKGFMDQVRMKWEEWTSR
jgi:anti-sigma factor RsiW